MGLLENRAHSDVVIQHLNEKPLIQANNLSVKFVLGNKREDLQSLTYNILKKKKKDEYWALRDINLTCYSGEILGIIGANGAGKTTLCRVISGLLRPDIGDIRVNGDVSALLSLGTGFNNELSGEENVYLNGMMLGLSKKEINVLLPEIVEFSGLQRFIQQPLKHYSSGMRSRLGFSIAAMIEPQVLVLDETLSVGDLEFSNKAAQKMQDIVSKAKLVIVVTHQTEFVQKYCTKALWIDKGKVASFGAPENVVASYKESIASTPQKTKIVELAETRPRAGTRDVVIVNELGLRFSLSQINKEKDDSFWALKNVSFKVREGDILGIIGPNGAGKTTLCRVLSGILKEDKGEVHINGDITALLTFGTGFNPQLTGRDNIFLNGMMLGIRKKKLEKLYIDIVKFSGLEKFMDKPVKSYSKGMISRLGFSVAAMIKPDVFIIDEALSVGDASFYEKASYKIQEMIGKAKAVIVVTHNMGFVEKVCTRALWLEKGKITFDGDPKEVVTRYRQSVNH